MENPTSRQSNSKHDNNKQPPLKPLQAQQNKKCDDDPTECIDESFGDGPGDAPLTMSSNALSSEKELFEKAAAHLPQVLAKVTVADENLLYLYARYKQATEGPCNTSRPGLFEFQAKKKWDAWNSIKSIPKEQAQSEYVSRIQELDPEWKPEEKPINPTSKASWVSVSSMAGIEEDILPDDQKTAFDWCKDGKLDPMKKVISQTKMDINEPDKEGLTLLHWACDRGHLNIAQHLLKNKVNVDQTDEEGQTALHYACACGHADIVKVLLENKADLRIKDSQGETALQMCESEDVKKLLSTWTFWRGSGEMV